jgi:hypothetical protein
MNQSTSMDGSGRSAETPTESLVRTVLQQHANALPPEDPSVDALRRRGRRHRRVRDAAASVVAVALVCGVALGTHAAIGGSPGRATAEASSPSTSASGASGAGPDNAPPAGWTPGPKLQVPTYKSVPSWMDKTDASDQLGSYATQNHDVNSPGAPNQGCLSLGSSPLLWPKGFYAEGTPLTVFDPDGRAVYVFDVGFTGADGFPRLGWGNGRLAAADYSLTGCPSSLSAIASYSLLIIFG